MIFKHFRLLAKKLELKVGWSISNFSKLFMNQTSWVDKYAFRQKSRFCQSFLGLSFWSGKFFPDQFRSFFRDDLFLSLKLLQLNFLLEWRAPLLPVFSKFLRYLFLKSDDPSNNNNKKSNLVRQENRTQLAKHDGF